MYTYIYLLSAYFRSLFLYNSLNNNFTAGSISNSMYMHLNHVKREYNKNNALFSSFHVWIISFSCLRTLAACIDFADQ